MGTWPRSTTRATTTQALPWLLQHSVFILNKYLVKDTGTTAPQNNYHKPYNNPICQFGEAVLADTGYLVNYKLRQRNLDQKIKGLWIGKDPTTDEHLIALPPVYDNHPSVTGAIYKCRGVTRLPRPNMWDTTFLATIQWPPMESMDYIEPDVSENYKVPTRAQHKYKRTTCTTTTTVPTSARTATTKSTTKRSSTTTTTTCATTGTTGHYYKSCSTTTTTRPRTCSCTTTWTTWYYCKSTTYCTTTTASTTTACCWTTTT